MYYEVKLQTTKKVEGKNSEMEQKTVNEHYIANCETPVEAYYKAMELYNNECDVYSIVESKIKEIINQKVEEKPFFKAVISDTYTDEKGNEKENKYYVLVCAKDVTEANKLMQEYLKQGYDMQLTGINKTKIVDLI